MLALLLACVAPEDAENPAPASILADPRAAPAVPDVAIDRFDASRFVPPPAPDEVLDVPIVIGAGVSGLAAAMDLGDAVVFEAADVVGGRARWSGGHLWLVGTPEQAAAGLEDGADLAHTEWEALTGAQPTSATSAYLGALAGVRQRLVDLGLTFSLGRTDPATGRVREHRVSGGGEALVGALAGALPAGVEVRLSTPVRGLVIVDGRAAGVRTDAGWVASDTVIIATGGFVDRVDLVALHTGWTDGSWRMGDDLGADGAALDWAAASGLGTAGLDAIGSYRDVLGIPGPDGSALQARVVGTVPWVWVDASGERFVDEGATWSVVLNGLARARTNVWAITTYQGLAPFVDVDDLPYLTEGEGFRCAERWDALADVIAVDPEGLATTVEKVASFVEGTATDPLGRASFRPLDGSPCAVRPGSIAAKNFGGLAVDDDGRVLDAAGGVVPGLWAVGEAAGMGVPGMGGAWGFDGSLSAVVWSGWRTAGVIAGD